MSFKITLAQDGAAAPKKTINFEIQLKDMYEFFADSAYGTSRPDPVNLKYTGPYPTDLFCVDSNFEIFKLEENTNYEFTISMDAQHEGYTNLQIEEFDMAFLAKAFPGFNWNGLFRLNQDHCAPVIEIIPSVLSSSFYIQTNDEITDEYRKNLQYDIIFSFEVNGEKKWGVIDPLVEHTNPIDPPKS
ncbi:MAG: hypothetical protein F6K17_33460 [Okeania sp. SIO3C4]|nr:hypothetical protein [Okeania sp. SIO3C4]